MLDPTAVPAVVNVSAEVQSLSESSNPPGGEPNTVRGARLPFGTLSACAAAAVAAVCVAIFTAPGDIRIAVAISASITAVLLCAAITAAVYFRAQIGRERHLAALRVEQADARTAAVIAEAEARLSDGHRHIQSITEAGAEQARETKESDNRRAAAMAAFAGAAGRMQAMSTSMLAELREMEHRHADPKVLADLLELDHRTAQAGRLADSIAVLSGSRSGRRWAKPIAMESILRGAMGRVAGYQRVRLRAVAEIAIAGHAAEGIMHALAELLDNACNFSPPTTEVHVYAAEVPAGVVITIEDSGLVMSESALRRAELTVSGRGEPGAADPTQRGSRSRYSGAGSDLSSLSGTRLGLAVVGYLARKHDLTVSYRPSAIGGTAVVVVVPRELTTRLDRTPGSLAAIPLPARSPGAPALTSGDPGRPAALTSPEPERPAAARAGAATARTGGETARTGAAPALTAGDAGSGPSLTAADSARPSSPPMFTNSGPSHPPHTESTYIPPAFTSREPHRPGAPAEFTGGDAAGPRTSPGMRRIDAFLADADSALFGVTSASAVNALAFPEGAAGFSGSTSALADRSIEAAAVEENAPTSTVSGLPRRRRGQTLAAVHPEGLAALHDPAGPAHARPVSPSALGAFQRAVNGRENASAATPSPSALETDK
ncbi:sensor histidine kinase [Nocardia sp. NBC_01327]|uniref:sensor histidine kinase n=1 Tax=Nocardia sp. NBC_01327 TaxID=2903593 RepID=UPI002E0E9FDD|nr:ATP-binding protein [Nocardia sp. NBC_01327]